ncbi:hypothetical protein AB0D54_38495 [Streptomyces xanthophaeus]|uniref:hypothetical protein n=1 Tax=Streptomyces xanthophaeus TaxID=67385 RepID=UPI0034120567
MINEPASGRFCVRESWSRGEGPGAGDRGLPGHRLVTGVSIRNQIAGTVVDLAAGPVMAV